MDGFESHDNIVVIAATNMVEVLDAALIRPGRFDVHIHVGLCEEEGRLAILKVHAGKLCLDAGNAAPDLRYIARNTVGFTGAELAGVANDAALLAVRANRDRVGAIDFEAALQRANQRFKPHNSSSNSFSDSLASLFGRGWTNRKPPTPKKYNRPASVPNHSSPPTHTPDDEALPPTDTPDDTWTCD